MFPGGRGVLHLRHPAQYVVAAFATATLAGTALLLIPAATAPGQSTGVLTALFTATSAVCVTGLVVVETPTHWSSLGEAIILVLIQVGGFGIMAMSSLVVVLMVRRLGLRQRVVAAAESGTLDVGDVRRVLTGVARLALSAEAVAAVVLMVRFWWAYDEPVARAAYLGVFHAVSAFNNAGFALFGDSMVGFAQDPVILLVVAGSVVAGGLGYPVWVEVIGNPRHPARWNLHAKLTVVVTVTLLLAGWLLLMWFEWTNPNTLGELSSFDSSSNALFHSVMPRSGGFNSIEVAAMREPSRLLTEVLMFIGGGSASTAGGIKVSTFALLGWVLWAEARGDSDVVAFDRRIPPAAQRQAVAVVLLALGLTVTAAMALMGLSSLGRADLLFEAVSAIGIVGLSAGATPLLPAPAQLVVVALMLLGRVGPVTLFAGLVLRERQRLYRHPEERPIIG